MPPAPAGATRRTSGLLFVDKPAGVSSHDVVAIVRRAARTRRVGHAGTLDPFATGLLVLAVGPCTRLLPHIVGDPKVYETTIRLGHETDTDDATGATGRTAELPPIEWLTDPMSADRLAAEAQLTGAIAQIPPVYSAKHVDGRRAYDLARRGEPVALPAVTVRVDHWDWVSASGDTLTTRITCGPGTYIRALARDLGRAMHSAAHCGTLRRLASGPVQLSQAVALEQLAPGAIVDGGVALHSPVPALGAVAHQPLDDAQLKDLQHGRPVRATVSGARAALLRDGDVVAMAERIAHDRWQPRVVLLGEPSA